MVSNPRPAWGFFVILCLLHRLARLFWLACPVSPGCEDTSSVVSSIPLRWLSLFLHPNITVANLSRPILSRMARNNSRGTATSAHDLMAPAFEMDSKPVPFSNDGSCRRRLVSYWCCSRCRTVAPRWETPRWCR